MGVVISPLLHQHWPDVRRIYGKDHFGSHHQRNPSALEKPQKAIRELIQRPNKVEMRGLVESLVHNSYLSCGSPHLCKPGRAGSVGPASPPTAALQPHLSPRHLVLV